MQWSFSFSLLVLVAVSFTKAEAAAIKTILRGGTIISYNKNTSSIQVLRNSSILVDGDRIVAIEDAFSPEVERQARVINVEGKIISPGFVDTHRHGWQTAMRTMASNTTLAEYFARYGEFSPAASSYTPRDVYIGQLTGLYEALNAGVTSILDHAHHTFSRETSILGLQASVDSGARVWWAYAIHQLASNFTIDQQFDDLQNLAVDEKRIWSNTPVTVGIAYDRFASAPASEVHRALSLAKQANLSVLTTHYVGPPFGGGNSVSLLESYSALNSTFPVVLSHASGLNQDEANLLRQRNQYISITPESEHHYGHDHPNSWHIQDQASLGVDTHFTFSTDIVSQARLWLQVTRLRLYRMVLGDWKVPAANPMSVDQAFLLATRNGGLALHRDDIGIIAPGAKVDIVVFRGDSPGMIGWHDPVAAVLLHSNVGDIEHVMVDGIFRKMNGRLVNVDWSALSAEFLTSSARIQKLLLEEPRPILQGEASPGIFYGPVETVQVSRGNETGQ